MASSSSAVTTDGGLPAIRVVPNRPASLLAFSVFLRAQELRLGDQVANQVLAAIVNLGVPPFNLPDWLRSPEAREEFDDWLGRLMDGGATLGEATMAIVFYHVFGGDFEKAAKLARLPRSQMNPMAAAKEAAVDDTVPF